MPRAPELAQVLCVSRAMTDDAYARYFAERELFEREMSERAKRVAEVHSEMAERYEALAKVFGAKRDAGPITRA